MFEQLRAGATTIELLGLDPARATPPTSRGSGEQDQL